MADLLTGKVIIVTGAGRGVGAAIAKLAAREGAKVVVNDLGGDERGEGADLGPAESTVAAIRAAGGTAVASGANIASWDQAHQLIGLAIDAFGGLDAVVNNAGILRDVIFHKMTEAHWDSVIAVNLKGCFNVARAAAPYFRERETGSFIHMTSTNGLIGDLAQVGYGSAKMGLVALPKCIALDMHRFSVRSNCIAPFAWTRMVAAVRETPLNRTQLHAARGLTPDKVAPLSVALCSDATKDVTGQIFGIRMNEIFLFDQSRPVRSVHIGEGWTPQRCVDQALPAMRPSFQRLDRSSDVFTWNPV
jgi:NAD(P)-dependent dehydrogenase (short-subunit alcohol dehydrogenase family)